MVVGAPAKPAPVVAHQVEVQVVAAHLQRRAAAAAVGGRIGARRGVAEGGQVDASGAGNTRSQPQHSRSPSPTSSPPPRPQPHTEPPPHHHGPVAAPHLGLAVLQLLHRALVEHERRGAGGRRQALLAARVDGVNGPVVGVERHAAQAAHRVDEQQGAVGAAHLACSGRKGSGVRGRATEGWRRECLSAHALVLAAAAALSLSPFPPSPNGCTHRRPPGFGARRWKSRPGTGRAARACGPPPPP